MPLLPTGYEIKNKILRSRTNFAYHVAREKAIREGCVVGGLNASAPNNPASIMNDFRIGAINTTPAELDLYLASAGCSTAPTCGLRSKGNTTDGGYTVGAEPEKDMGNEGYTEEFDPYSYQSAFFPGMADFVDSNIVAGDKSSDDRLNASWWNDLGGDIFDDWGYFYIYDVETGKYYFPLLDPQNQDDGVLTTQTFTAFGRTFTIQHGWSVQGIFKIDISAADTKPFRFGSYGNMGSDGSTLYENLSQAYTLSDTDLTLYYLHNQENGSSDEQLYVYYVPKTISQNTSQTYEAYYDGDDMNIMSNPVTCGVIVYYAKTNDVKDWVMNDLELV